MTQLEFLELLSKLSEERPIEVHEQIEMTEVNGEPILLDGEPLIEDVVTVGDGRFYIERDDNEPQAVQLVIDLLANLDEHLPELVQAYHHYIENEGA